ncbi:MAG: DEAD/DEAH box helicase [Phycisphaerae bacterium]|jgi:ATP-dependent RNA helicase DeaD
MHKQAELPKAFADLGIEIRFLKALAKMQFVEPSDVQSSLIPHALSGRDILGQAQTGTGKTAAFGLPILQKMDPAGRLQALCLAPTRELAVQVSGELSRLALYSKLNIVTIYGGQKVATQLHKLGRKPHFVVGTPGRVQDFMRRGALKFDSLQFVVLDEVDRMLDIGFRDDIKAILRTVKSPHQTIFVSATIDDEIKRLARQFMQDPVEVDVSRDHMTVDEVDQSYITVDRHDKFRLLRLVLKQEDPPVCIVFCNTKAAARKLAKKLHDAGLNAKEIHGDLMQRRRDRVMEKFRRHQIRVLVATDLAARGIDVSEITHIINYDIPPDPEVYVHRIGRTARMGARGKALTLVTREEGKELTNIEKLINKQIPVRNVSGFTPRPVRDEPEHEPEPLPVSRFEAPVYAADGAPAKKPPPKTLGSRFKPARKRRRL